MKILIIGGTGHIGTYLIPRLVQGGHEVVQISRQKRSPYQQASEWKRVESIQADRHAEEQAGTFAKRIVDLHPSVVIDNICYSLSSATQLVEALRGKIRQYIFTGTIWVHGEAEIVPTPESARRRPIGEYGIAKNAIEQYLLEQNDFPSTTVHPGHIVGPGWACANPQAHFNLNVFQTIADGGELTLPNLGLECLHHVHADDVAQCLRLAMENPSQAIGESFHAVSPAAITLLGYARAAYAWFNKAENIRFAPIDELAKKLEKTDAQQMIEHIRRSPCISIEKARRLLGYEPRYTSLQACKEAVDWMIAQGKIRA